MGTGKNTFGTHVIHLPKLDDKYTSITKAERGHGEHRLRMVRVMPLGSHQDWRE